MKVRFLAMKVCFLATKVDFLSTKVCFLATKVRFLSTKVGFLLDFQGVFWVCEGLLIKATLFQYDNFSLRCLVPKTHDLIVYGVLQRLCQFFQTRQRLKIATLAGYINAFKHNALKAFVMPKGVKAFGPTYIGFALLGVE